MNFKLFKPLNEQIQVIKIKRQGIADSEREELIESIINGDAVESLTEDVELASINEGLTDAVVNYYLKKNKKLAGKSSRKKYDTEIGNYYEDEEKNSASAHADKVRGLRDRVKSDIGNMDQAYRNREISAKEYKKGIKRLNKDAAKDLYHLNKENYNSNVEAANLKRKQAKEDEKVEKFYKKHNTSFDDLNKAFNDAAGNKPEENKPIETEKAVNFHKTGGLEEVAVKKETPVENKVVETAKPVENKPVENNRDEEFEKRVNDEVSKRYQAKLDDDAKKKQERQAEITAKRKATYEANKAKKAAEAPSKDPVVKTPKPEEPKHEEPVKEAPSKDAVESLTEDVELASINEGLSDAVMKDYLKKKINITIWGKEFLLPVRFDCYTGEEVTKQQINAVNLVIKNSNWIEKARSAVEKYCKKAVDSDSANLKKDDVFSYAKPEYFYIKRDEGKEYSRVCLMIKYKYDLSHGLAVVFDNKGTAKVCTQDEIL